MKRFVPHLITPAQAKEAWDKWLKETEQYDKLDRAKYKKLVLKNKKLFNVILDAYKEYQTQEKLGQESLRGFMEWLEYGKL